MLYKLISVVIEVLFPKTHLEDFLCSCTQLEFESKLVPRLQTKQNMFFPFYYKDSFVRDCIIELKERNNRNVARLFSFILFRFIAKTIEKYPDQNYYIVPVPQHLTKTREKGFCHTTTLSIEIYKRLKERKVPNISIKPCIVKIKNIKKLHSTNSKQKRISLIKNSMRTYVTKQDAKEIFFIIDDVYTSGVTFKEARRSLLGCGVLQEHIFFISIAH